MIALLYRVGFAIPRNAVRNEISSIEGLDNVNEKPIRLHHALGIELGFGGKGSDDASERGSFLGIQAKQVRCPASELVGSNEMFRNPDFEFFGLGEDVVRKIIDNETI